MYRDSASQVRDGCGTRWRYLPVNVCIMAWVSLPRELPVKVSVSHGARGRLQNLLYLGLMGVFRPWAVPQKRGWGTWTSSLLFSESSSAVFSAMSVGLPQVQPVINLSCTSRAVAHQSWPIRAAASQLWPIRVAPCQSWPIRAVASQSWPIRVVANLPQPIRAVTNQSQAAVSETVSHFLLI